MTIQDRVKELRKQLKLSQEAFGEKLGVSKSVIVNIELNRAPMKELMFKHICRTFNVNPLWLEKGEGEVFLDTPNSILEDLTVEFDLSPTEKNIVTNYLRMSPEDRRKVSELLRKLLGE